MEGPKKRSTFKIKKITLANAQAKSGASRNPPKVPKLRTLEDLPRVPDQSQTEMSRGALPLLNAIAEKEMATDRPEDERKEPSLDLRGLKLRIKTSKRSSSTAAHTEQKQTQEKVKIRVVKVAKRKSKAKLLDPKKIRELATTPIPKLISKADVEKMLQEEGQRSRNQSSAPRPRTVAETVVTERSLNDTFKTLTATPTQRNENKPPIKRKRLSRSKVKPKKILE